MGSILFMLVPLRGSLCFGAKPTQKAWPQDRKWRREGRSQRRQRESVDKGRKKRTVGLRYLSREGGSEKMEGGQSRNESAFLVALWKLRSKFMPAIACKCTESCTKVSQTPSSCTWSWPKPVFVRLFLFFNPLGCVLCICKETCNAPGRKWEKPLDNLI